MVKAKILLGINLCLLSIYIVALKWGPEILEISCAKNLWYLTLLDAIVELISSINRVGAMAVLGDHETTPSTIYSWHKSQSVTGLFLICQVTQFLAKGMIVDNMIWMSSSCKKTIQRHTTFWLVIELQAYIFIVSVGILAVIFIFFLGALLVLGVFGRNIRQVLRLEASEPVPVNHGIELVEGGETKPRRASVKKTDDDEKACSICRENEKTHACIPCGHLCLCAMCAEDLSKKGVYGQIRTRCPICRLEADNFSRIYQ